MFFMIYYKQIIAILFLLIVNLSCSLESSFSFRSSYLAFERGVMVTTWQIDDETVPLTLALRSGYNYDFTVDWGDGSPVDAVVSWDDPNKTHQYASPGTYTVTLRGHLEAWYRSDSRLIRVDNLGDVGWTNLGQAFAGAENLVEVYGGNLSQVTTLEQMFNGARRAIPSTRFWDTSNVTSMYSMFANTDMANPDTELWDVSNVTNMWSMFDRARSANPDVSRWDVSSVTSMWIMFRYTEVANPDVSRWDVSNVTDMRSMFRGAQAARPDVSGWNTRSLQRIRLMFQGAPLANPDVSSWDVSNVVDMSHLFRAAPNANPDMSSWDLGSLSAGNESSDEHSLHSAFINSALSDTNYSNLLIRLEQTNSQTPQPGQSLRLDAPNNTANSQAACDARSALITRGWTINDIENPMCI